MTKFYNGTVTIDEQMFLQKADEEFHKFVNQDLYAPISQSIHVDDVHRLCEAMEGLKQGMPKNMVSVRLKRYDGKYRWVLMELTYEPFDIKGTPLIHLNFTDLAQHEERNNELVRLNNEQDALISLMDGMIMSYDMETDQLQIYSSVAGQKMNYFEGSLGNWKELMLDGKVASGNESDFLNMCDDIIAGKKNFHYNFNTSFFSRSGIMELCFFKCQTIRSIARIHKVLGYVTLRSPNREREIIAGIESNKDVGIDVLNKRAITEYAKRITMEGNGKVYFVVLDLDDFKTVNDTLGHMFGDEVLAATAEIIKAAVGNRGVVGRIGGDELFIVVDKVEEDVLIRSMLRNIRTDVEWLYKGKHENVNITCSMGIAVYPDHGSSYETVFALADKMLYLAKEKGKNRYIIYTPEIHDEKLKMDKDKSSDKIRELRNDKIGVMYRMLEDFLVKRIVTYESLLTEIGYAFELDEIIIAQNYMTATTRWCIDGEISAQENMEVFRRQEDFLAGFDENNLFILNGMFNFEGRYPLIYERLKEKGIEAAIFYRIKKDDVYNGFVMFGRKERRQMWSEYDKTFLAAVGKVIEIYG